MQFPLLTDLRYDLFSQHAAFFSAKQRHLHFPKKTASRQHNGGERKTISVQTEEKKVLNMFIFLTVIKRTI